MRSSTLRSSQPRAFSVSLPQDIAFAGLQLSPGPTVTRFGDNLTGLPSLFPRLMKRIPFLFSYPERGARTPVYVASSPDLDGVSGRFFLRCRETRTKRITYDADVAARLWSLSEELCENRGAA
jgi:hypothetical protein